MKRAIPLHVRWVGGLLAMLCVAGAPLACDRRSPSTRGPDKPPATRDTADPQLASDSSPADPFHRSISAFLTAAHQGDFNWFFGRSVRYQNRIEAIRRDNPAEQEKLIKEYRLAESGRFIKGECDPDLQELLNLLRPSHRVRIRTVVAAADFEYERDRFKKVIKAEVLISYESGREAPLFEGVLLRQALVTIVLDEATSRYITSSRARDNKEATWEQIPLSVYAASTQTSGAELAIDVLVMGGRQPVTVCLRSGSTVLWRKTRESEGVGLMRTVRFNVPMRSVDEQWLAPSEWTIAAYDASGDIQARPLSGRRWTPLQPQPYSENRIWWIADPWRIAWQWNPLSGLRDAQQRDLLLNFGFLSPAEREQLVSAINEENEAQVRQRAGMKVAREGARTIMEFTIVPNAWSIPFSTGGSTGQWELQCGGRQVEVLLSNGQHFGLRKQAAIDVPADCTIHFRSLEPGPITAKFITNAGSIPPPGRGGE